MTDAFYEQLVPLKTSIKDLFLVILSTVGTFLLCFILFRFFGSFVIFLAFAGLLAIWNFLVPRMKQEYEYYLLNSTLEVSKILNKEKRQSIMEFDLRKSEIVAPVDSPELEHFRPTKKLDFTSGSKNNNVYSIIIPMEHALYNILIEPDEKMQEQMKIWLAHKMK